MIERHIAPYVSESHSIISVCNLNDLVPFEKSKVRINQLKIKFSGELAMKNLKTLRFFSAINFNLEKDPKCLRQNGLVQRFLEVSKRKQLNRQACQ